MSSSGDQGGLSPLKQALLAVQTMRARVAELERAANEPIAIVGAGLRFPGGAVDRASYWRLLAGGVDAIRTVPGDRWDIDQWYDPDPDAPGKMAIRVGGFLDDVATFDAEFFGIAPREALEMDPAQRLLLQVAWEALEDAGIPAERVAGTATGVYIGLGLSDYARRHFLSSNPEKLGPYSGTGSFLSVAAGRLSYFLGLQGPAVTVDTACSSSLVGVHLAVAALRLGECDVALAGGANLVLAPEPTVYFSQIHAMSPTGRCRTFDAGADGYVRGEGAGVVVLKRLSDALATGDRVLAVIRGSAVNQDGRSNGLTAPSAKAQAAVIRAALANAGVQAGQVGLVEAHGTGTPLGDPIEFEALKAVYGVDGVPLRLGSVKTNFGHLETAAGVAGLIKAALALHEHAVPPHLHLNAVNPRIVLEGTRFEIAREGASWPADGPRFAAVSSFGLSGTNAHVILEEAPPALAASAGGPAVVPLSARDARGVAALASRWADEIAARGLTPVAVGRVAALGRSALGYRTAVVASSSGDLVARLRDLGAAPAGAAPSRVPGIGFLFTGQGAQYPGMCRALYDASPIFRATVDQVAGAVDLPLREVLWGDARIHDTAFTQPALYAVEVALARVWESWGVVPDVMLGHSVGEIAAATIAGVFSVEDGARLVAERGRLMQALPRDGSMLAIFAAEETVRGLVAPHAADVAISGQNGPTETVISGRTPAVDAIAAACAAQGIKARALVVSHAFHSPLMDPILDAFESFVSALPRSAPRRVVISDLDGREAGDRLTDPRYWRNHLRHAVRFADGFAALRAAGATVFVEVGPKPILTGMAQRCAGDGAGLSWVVSQLEDGDAYENLLAAAGAAWVAGLPVDWRAVYPERAAQVDLPLYPWAGDRYWLEAEAPAVAVAEDPVWEIAWRVTPAGEPRERTWRVVGSEALGAALGARDGATDDVVLMAGGLSPEGEVERALALLRTGGRLWIVYAAGDLAASALSGLGRVIAVELPERWGGTVEVVGDLDVAALAATLRSGDEEQVQLRGAERRAARLVRARRALGAGLTVDPARTWLITGGFGALGLQIARWLVSDGARHLVLVGRTGAGTSEGAVEALRAGGVRVDSLAVDIAAPGALEEALARLGVVALQGIVHAAGTGHDARLDAITADQIGAVFRPKASGALALHELTRRWPVEHLLLLGSASAWFGTPGQGAYAAANAWLDAFAAWRRSQGLPANAVMFGPWAGEGMAGRVSAGVKARWAEEGIGLLEPEEALDVLSRAVAPRFVAARFDFARYAVPRTNLSVLRSFAASSGAAIRPAETGSAMVQQLQKAPPGARRALLVDHLQGILGTVLGLPSGKRLEARTGFFDAGMDSLTALDLRNRLQRSLGTTLSATVAFDYPSVGVLVDHLMAELDLGEAVAATEGAAPVDRGEPIAIVGLACRFPGGADPTAFWDLLADGRDAVREIPPDRWPLERYYDPTPATPGKTYNRHAGLLDEIKTFEPAFFGISPREAEVLDPQQRMLLETAWEALEDAAIDPRRLVDSQTGVFVGIGGSEYGYRFPPLDEGGEPDPYSGTGNESSFAAGRVAYVLGLRGPALSINTACSSSLVAVHQAAQALRAGECDLALAGGANAIVSPEVTVQMAQLRALSPDGRCATFDAAANGYVRGEGAGMVVLRRLSDAIARGERVHALLRGSAVNHDGRSSGLTVPNGAAQQAVIRAALAAGGVDPLDVDYVECHGTGTPLGDPIEVRALGEVYGHGRTDPLRLGSVKTNVGHLEAGAGMAGLLKAVLSLEHQAIPAHLHLKTPNPALPLETFHLTIPTVLTPWTSERPRIAGVSSFGISGTNAHILLQEAPPDARQNVASTRPLHLLAVSGRTEAAAAVAAAHLADALERGVDLSDAAFTANTGRAALEHRRVAVAADRAGLVAALRGEAAVAGQATDSVRLVFLCTGAGPQAVNMGKSLYDSEPVFRAAMDEAFAELDRWLDRPLAQVIYPEPGQEDGSPINLLAYTQPAMFAIEYAFAQLWASWGVRPDAVIGHSTGQYVAAVLAGVFSLADGARLITARSRLMSDEPEIGEMVAIFAAEDRVRAAIDDPRVSIAAINSAEEVVISGLREPVLAIAARFEKDGVEVRRLRISHAAHSPLMDPVLDRFEAVCREVQMHAPRIPLIENVRGEVAGDEITTPAYWREHMRQGVMFHAGMRTLAWLGFRHFLEIGNHPILCGNGARSLPDVTAWFYPSIRRKAPEWAQLLESAGRLWANGVDLDWAGFHRHAPGRRISLPTYPFERKRFWVDRRDQAEAAREVGAAWTYERVWRPAPAAPVGAPRTFLLLADAGGMAQRLSAQLAGSVVGSFDDVEALIAAKKPTALVSLVPLDAPAPGDDPIGSARRATETTLRLLQLAARSGLPLAVVTVGATDAGGEIRPSQAPVWGLGTVAGVELSDVRFVRIDVDPADPLAGLADALQTEDGEDAVALRGGSRLVARLVRSERVSSPVTLRADATYLVTGGLGALGRSVAGWLVENGANSLVLTGRGEPGEGATAAIARLRAAGASVSVVAADVSVSADVDRILAGLSAPLAGIFHAAGVLDDGALLNLDWNRFPKVWAAKVAGTWWLHEKTKHLPLDLFVGFSSAAALIGSAGQANYAAGNAFLDAVLAMRRAAGLAGQSHAWGPWADAGLATETSRVWEAGGVAPLVPRSALSAMGRALGIDAPLLGIVAVDWKVFTARLSRVPPLLAEVAERVAEAQRAGLRAELVAAPVARRRGLLVESVRREVARILRLEPAALDGRTGFFDTGMDSLMAVELVGKLKAQLEVQLPATLAFDHPNVEALTDHLLGVLDLGDAPTAALLVPSPVAAVDLDEPVAVIGIACRYPGGANDPAAFWELLKSGRDPMIEVPADRWDIDAWWDPTPATPGKMYTRDAGFLDVAIDQFDSEFFGISPREANSMDPQQRLLLECAWEALENAGAATGALKDSATAVFVGAGDSGYLQRFQKPGGLLYLDQYAGTGNLSAFLAGRVAYVLGLHGPNLTLNTACSSSLVATHLAIQALRHRECDHALAAGVHLMLSPENFVYVSQIKAVSADGRCKTFDASANGYGRAEGCGVVVLRRLADAVRDGDPILAVIRGNAVNHDGASSGLTVPNGQAQAAVIREALQRSGVAPVDVSFVETHGTGTVLGDPIEVHAIEATYGVNRPADKPLHIGAVKSNIGHMEVASGIASLIKTVLALLHRQVPAHLHLNTPNPDLDFDKNGIVVDRETHDWDWSATPRHAGVSSFGLSGTNVHLVLEEAPTPAPPAPRPVDDRPAHLLAISARSRSALQALAGRYATRLGEGESLPDLAWSAQQFREHQDWRLSVVAADAPTARERLAAFAATGDAAGATSARIERTTPRVAFLFSGQGSQYPGMGKALYAHEPSFRADVDRCAALLASELDVPLLDVLFAGPDDERVHDTRYTQPALFVVEWALAQLWTRWGVAPDALIGHSIGEIVAACYAGVFSLEDALRLVAARGRLMAELPRDGSMYAAFAEGPVVADLLAPHRATVGVAALNNPGETVLSGETQAVTAIAEALKAAGVDGRWLKVSHAFHSPLMEPMLDAFEAVARTVRYAPPKLPLVSNLGGAMAGGEVADPAYWRRHIREAVAFAAGMRTLRELGIDTFVEVGPHPTLLGMARRTITDLPGGAWLPSLKRDADAWSTLLSALGGLVVRGGSFDARAFDGPWARRRVPLPNYPWQRRRHWIAGEEFPGQESPLRDWTWEVEWSVAPATGAGIGVRHVAIVGDRGGVASALERELTSRGLQATVGANPPVNADAVVFLPALDFPSIDRADLAALSAARERGPAALATLVGELVTRGAPPRLSVVTRGVQAIEPGDLPNPLQATLWGLARVVRVEHAELHTRSIDLEGMAALDEARLLADAVLAGDGEPEIGLRRGRRYVPRLVPARPAATAVAIRGDAAYWVTGGLTGLGLALAKWLVGRGARQLVLTGRRPPSEDTQAVLADLESKGATVLVVSADVARPFDVDHVLAEIDRRKWDLRGIVHAAGVLDDAMLLRQTPERFAKVFGPKVEGTWNLHRATAGRSLDFFTLFSGGASLMGSPGQGNYAAANSFLDAFAQWRRASGLPALAINWGAWGEVGMAAALGSGHAAKQASEGIQTIPVKVGMNLWGRLLGHRGQIAVMPVDWNRFVQVFHGGATPAFLERVARSASGAVTQLAAASTQAAIEVDELPVGPTGLPELFDRLARASVAEHPAVIDAWVHELVIRVLDFDRAKVLDRATPLLDVGLDSLLAVELKNAMADGGVDLPVARLMTGPSLAIVNQLVGAWVAEHPPPEAAPRPKAAAALANPDELVGPAVRPTWEQVGTWRPAAAGEAAPAGQNAVMTHIGAFVLGAVAILAVYVLTQIGSDKTATDGKPGVEEVAPAPASKRRR